MTPADSITALIEQLRAGNPDAAQSLWERYYPRLVTLARSKLQGTPQRAADEEDVALSAFDSFCQAVAQGRLPPLVDRDSLWGRLLLITARKAADLANRNRRLKRGGGRVRGESVFEPPAGEDGGGGLDALAGDDPTPDLAAQLAEEFQALLDRLGDAELRSIAVWKLEGYRNAEIATRLGCSEVTVERRLRLIRKLLDAT